MLGLTGTAIQNKVDEVWSLLDVVNPGAVGDLSEFRAAYTTPLRNQMADGKRNDAYVEYAGNAARDHFQMNVLERFTLRRTKAGVQRIADELYGQCASKPTTESDTQEVPVAAPRSMARRAPSSFRKKETVMFLRLSEQQRDVYTKLLASPDFVAARWRVSDSMGASQSMRPTGPMWLAQHFRPREGDSAPCHQCYDENGPARCMVLSCYQMLIKACAHIEMIKAPVAQADERPVLRGQRQLVKHVLGIHASDVGGVDPTEKRVILARPINSTKLQVSVAASHARSSNHHC